MRHRQAGDCLFFRAKAFVRAIGESLFREVKKLINLIVGHKGSGKTKMLIDMVNKACEEENGSVVCIEGGRNLTYNIKYAARLVDICEYPIAAGVDAFFAFVCAIYSQNFDITHMFIDSLQKAARTDDLSEFARLLDNMEAFSEKYGVNFTVMLSCEREEAEKYLGKYLG